MNLKGKKYQGALSIVKTLRKNGFSAYFVGGCVRDLLMEKTPKDFDIATDALADQTESLFPKTHPIGKQFGVILVIVGGLPYEVATFRVDEGYSDGRRPDGVTFCTAEMDALRRDFTINGLFFDPVEKKVIDHVKGKKDIGKKIVRAIGDPAERFEEDKLRMLRAARFASTLDFEIEKDTWTALVRKAKAIKIVSLERIRDELVKIVTGPHASRGLYLLKESGILKMVLPEVEALVHIEQPPQFHPTANAFEHTRLLFDYLDDPGPRLAMAALLHDIGKARTMRKTDRIRFHNHDNVGASMAQDILKRLKFSNEDSKYIVRYIRNHMKFISVQQMRESTLKRFMGQDQFEEELELHKADCMASHKNIENYHFCGNKLKKLTKKDLVPVPRLKGKDLISMGYKPGPLYKKILEFAYNEQLEDEAIPKKTLIEKIRKTFPAE